MQVTGTHIAYLHICHRKLWLFANGIQMEQTSQAVAEGKLISETTYLDRSKKYTELAIETIKIDFYDAKNRIVHEVKKSDKIEVAHFAQLKYYLAVLARNGIEAPTGVLEYPKLKQKEVVNWDESILEDAKRWEEEVKNIVMLEHCPMLTKLSICKSCSYYEFCYINEK
jgi:CRISPR-associated exonuclease Cas4